MQEIYEKQIRESKQISYIKPENIWNARTVKYFITQHKAETQQYWGEIF